MMTSYISLTDIQNKLIPDVCKNAVMKRLDCFVNADENVAAAYKCVHFFGIKSSA